MSRPGSSASNREATTVGGQRTEHVALYGSLMLGLEGRAAVGLEGALRFEGECLIPGELFDLGPYPGLRPGEGAVRGELHRILDPNALARLDAFEDFDPARPARSLYLRQRIRLLEPRNAVAWVYVYNRETSPRQRVDRGDWRAHLAGREPRTDAPGRLPSCPDS